MKLALISDLHGNAPYIHSGVDIVVFAGDFLSMRRIEDEKQMWQKKYYPYLDEIKGRNISVIGIPGNHDYYPKTSKGVFREVSSHFDSFVTRGPRTIKGVSFYLDCWNKMEEWTWYKPEEEHKKMLDSVPTKQYDFIVTHTPAYDILSCQPDWGSLAIRDFVYRMRPKHAHVFGHCHSDFGVLRDRGMTHVNASYSDESNRPTNRYIEYDMKTKEFEIRETVEVY